ncbi:Oidioi.mRNA.OKI2018_I69.PAR.g11800.t2.cds [Oikopleura dioica]|uniref:Oidioi.mRNA.OKI2018_I69.PAR.g11800.t2.cds n=1 Tax=Oikopleura dioica TaxID=34765 RepID=A0ABN7RXD8_OIKDI|nr:Oidioi.mRNA.OKI2018_I69.PAR.g11800.t2.cds [Oikopleura dioica]
MSSFEEESLAADNRESLHCLSGGTGRDADGGMNQEENGEDDQERSGSLIKCEECGISCAGKSHYDVHIRSHTGERPYICKVCGFGFTQKGNLRRHMKIHSDEKPFECSICSYKCRRRDALNGHMRIHSDHRPFRCKFCDRSYKSRQSMKEHELAFEPIYDVPKFISSPNCCPISKPCRKCSAGKTERIQFPCLIPQRSVSSSTKSFTKSEDGLLPGQNHAKQDEEENHHRMLSTERNLLTSQSTETKIPGETLLPKCRKRSRSEESDTETEPATKRSKESDEDNEEVIVDVRNPDSCSEHEENEQLSILVTSATVSFSKSLHIPYTWEHTWEVFETYKILCNWVSK